MIDRRTLLAGALGLGALGVLSGCDAGGADATGRDGVPASWVRCRIPEPEAIDPLFVCDEGGLRVCSLVFDTLTKIDPVTGEVLPLACGSFDVSEDCRTFTFHLIEGATFHNGETVDAAAFERAWKRLDFTLLDTDTPAGVGGTAPVASAFTNVMNVLEGCSFSCPDGLTFAVTLSEPFADFPALAAHPILGPVPSAAENDLEAYGVRPVGNGPFRLAEDWDGSTISLERFDSYAGKKTSVPGALLVCSSDTHAAHKRFQTGAIDVCDVPLDLYDEAEESLGLSEDGCTVSPGQRLVRSEGPGLYALTLATTEAPLDSVEAREAIACAIDREALCQKILKDSAIAASSPISPALGAVAAWPGAAYDPDRAAELLDPLCPADEEGVRPLELTVLYRKGGVMGRIASQIAKDLKAVGIQVKLEGAEAGEFTGRRGEAGVSCTLELWQPDVADLGCAVQGLTPRSFHQDSDNPAPNRTYFDEELYEQLFLSRSTRDAAERAALHAQALAKMGEGLPLIPLAHPLHSVAASERVTSLYVDSYGHADLGRAILA